MGDTTGPVGTSQLGRRHAPIKPRRVGRPASPAARGDQAKALQEVVERAGDADPILTLMEVVYDGPVDGGRGVVN
jgi:hypothetical protein